MMIVVAMLGIPFDDDDDDDSVGCGGDMHVLMRCNMTVAKQK